MVFENRAIGCWAVAAVCGGSAAAVAAACLAVPPSSLVAQASLQEDSAAAAAPAPAPGRVPVPGETLTVHLLTVGPGDRVEELFGHNALLIRDSATGYEAAFNYGLYDPTASGFLWSFFKGRMMYRVAPLNLDSMLASYRAAGRRVWAQELDLEPADRLEILSLVETASLPENREYRYEYFLNNCSTKLRDVLDAALDGQLRAATDAAGSGGGEGAGAGEGEGAGAGQGASWREGEGASWRDHTRRLTASRLHYHAGIDLLLGPMGDEPTTAWQQMWIPMKLRDTVGGLSVARADGSRTRLVRSEAVWVESSRGSEPAASRSLELLFLFVGAAVGTLCVTLGRHTAAGSAWGRVALAAGGLLWGGFCFVAGSLLVAMHWTDHEFMYWNRNVLLFSPLGLGVALGLLGAARRGATGAWGRRFALGSTALALVALALYLVPATRQENLALIAFALPVHLAVCWVMLALHKRDDTLVYASALNPRRAHRL